MPRFLREHLFNLFLHHFSLALLVVTMRPEREAVAFESGDEVHVRMEDDLAGVFAIVHHEVHTIGVERALERLGDLTYRLHHGAPIFRGYIEDICTRGTLGHDERMARGDRMNVEEGERMFVFVDLVRGECPPNNFTEDAIVHIRHYKVQSSQWKSKQYQN